MRDIHMLLYSTPQAAAMMYDANSCLASQPTSTVYRYRAPCVRLALAQPPPRCPLERIDTATVTRSHLAVR